MKHLRELLIARQRKALAASGQREEQRFRFSLALFEHARDRIEHYRKLAGGRGGEVALGRIREILAELVRNELPTTADKQIADVGPRELTV
jgi:hypothetical protein